MNRDKRTRSLSRPTASAPGLMILALCFLGGVLLGQALLGAVTAETMEELERYLKSFLTLENGDRLLGNTLPDTALLYLRYPLLAFLLGFASIGVGLLPCAAAAFGFFLSFSVCCFTVSFGADGLLLALAVLGIRCAVTLPCFFLLAAPAFHRSVSLALSSFGRGRRVRPVSDGRGAWLRLAVVLPVLLAGMCVDLWLSPLLLEAVLKRILM